MLRAIAVGLFSIGCAGVPGEVTGVSEQATETDAGTDADADAGTEPAQCDWYVSWLSTINQTNDCVWGMFSHNISAALFRSRSGECLAEVSCGGVILCADLVGVHANEIVEVWGPAAFDPDSVWGARETYFCE